MPIARTLAALALSVAAAAPLARADIIPPGAHGIEHHIVIENLAEFPAYDFFVHPTHLQKGSQRVESGKPFRFYHFSAPRLIAVKAPAPEASALTDEFFADAARIRSDVKFSIQPTVASGDPTRTRVTTYRVKAIEGTKIVLELVRDERFDGDGKLLSAAEIKFSLGASLAAKVGVVALAGVVIVTGLRRRRAAA